MRGENERDTTRKNGVRSVCFLEVKLGSDCAVSFVRAVALLCKCVRSSGHRAGGAQCLDDTNGTIGKVENEEEKEKEHNCVVVVTRTNVVDPVAVAAVNECSGVVRVRVVRRPSSGRVVATTKQIGDERTKDDY